MLYQDARLYQILFLSLFLLLGIGTRDWTLQPTVILTAILTCGITQWIGLRLTQPTPQADQDSPAPETNFYQAIAPFSSSLITSLGMSLLLRVDHPLTMMLACMAAIASKFILRVQGKHLFNPGNFGIVIALLLTQNAWVSPGQWGEESWFALIFLAAGGLVLQKVGRWDTTVTFLGSYALLEALRNLWLGWTWDVWAHRLMSGSLLLFALFMITDPRTIPDARVGRVIWAIAIAVLTFILRNYFFISTAAFWALFALAPTSILLDMLFKAPRFVWFPNPFISATAEQEA